MALREVGLPEATFGQRAGELGPAGLRKLGIAAARMKGATSLLLDEPLSGLDTKAAVEVVELLEELRQEGKAMLITMQELFWARQLADRVGILQEGRQALTRTRQELGYENLEKLYLDYMRGGLRPGDRPEPTPR
jgi:ABC-type multidrug transport system ATPase subunit